MTTSTQFISTYCDLAAGGSQGPTEYASKGSAAAIRTQTARHRESIRSEMPWETRTTNDEEQILSWFESGEPVNIGVLLGPRSGIIDELDSPEAKAAWESLGLERGRRLTQQAEALIAYLSGTKTFPQ